MPLRAGSSKEIIGENIAELIRSGHDPAQAAAIAYKKARGEDRAAGICYRAADSVLLLMRSPSATDYPLTWGFPGGGIESGELPEQAAMRESTEEIGYAPETPLSVLDYDEGFTTFGAALQAPFAPTLNAEHCGYVWASLSSLPSPLHPGVAATLGRLPVECMAMDARIVDGNGWFEIKANPISKAGVFPYSGRQLGLDGPDADRIFQVFRPPEELSDPECVESFKLLPWIDEHIMLGPVAQEMTGRAVPAERKGVQGVIGEDVFFKDGTLYANIKAFSSSLAALIEAGKRELSAGYRCMYDMTAGVWNGLHYDAVQRKIRGNHLALVSEGRMGPDVAVMDRFNFSFDAKELNIMADPVNNDGEMSLAEISAAIKAFAPLAAQVAEMQKMLAQMASPAAAEPAGDADPVAADPAAAPAADADPVAAEKQPAPAMDAAEIERNVIASLSQRDALAAKLSKHVGTFDHARMTLADVVGYGCEKLGIEAPKGQEAAALSGFLQARPSAVPAASVSGMDSAPGAGSFVTKHLESKGE